MNSEELSEILMFGIGEMHKLLKDIDSKGFDMEKCKVKIAANNSLTLTAKTLIQNEVLKTSLEHSRRMTALTTSEIMREDD